MKLDPISCGCFVAVMEENTIAAAAEREHMPHRPSAAAWPTWKTPCAWRCFTRSNKGRHPTAAAFALLHLARGVLNDLDGIASQMREYGTGVRGHITAGGGQHLGHHPIPASPAAGETYGAAPISGRCAAAGNRSAQPLPVRWPKTRQTLAS